MINKQQGEISQSKKGMQKSIEQLKKSGALKTFS